MEELDEKKEIRSNEGRDHVSSPVLGQMSHLQFTGEKVWERLKSDRGLGCIRLILITKRIQKVIEFI